jgi:hypothetical protein
MIDISKAHLSADGEHVKLTMPISKVDVEKRIVSGFATLDNVDRQGDIVTSEASQKAFERFRGNVRLMHQPIPAGKVVNFRQDTFYDKETDKQYNGVFVDTYISKGAPEVWEMVLDGTLTGFSIGGAVHEIEKVYDKALDATVRVIKDYDLIELSLVDSPANQLANIFSIEKVDKDGVAIDSIFNKSSIQNVFWCETDQLAYADYSETRDCLVCEKDLSPIGWMDTVEGEDMSKAMGEIVANHLEKGINNIITDEDVPGKYPSQIPGRNVREPDLVEKPKINEKPLNKAEKFSVGDFVQWNSSGGTARGKVTRVVTRGKIAVPNSSVTITATEDDPAVVITVYRQDAEGRWRPTDTKVGHKMKTLRAWTTKVLKSLTENSVEKTDKATQVAQPLIKGGVEVAENTENTEAVEAPLEEVEIVEETEAAEETVEKSDEVVETVDEVVEEAEDAVEEVAADEVAEVPADASTEDGEAAGVDVEKALDSVKAFITESFEKSFSESEKSIANVATAVAEVAKATTEKHEELNKAIAEVNAALAALNGRVESVENDTAVRKSAEIENIAEFKTTTVQKSLWGGRFLGSAELFN